jgi:hypothetical protein
VKILLFLKNGRYLFMEISKRRNYSEKTALSKEFNLPAIGEKNGTSLGCCEVKLVKSDVK